MALLVLTSWNTYDNFVGPKRNVPFFCLVSCFGHTVEVTILTGALNETELTLEIYGWKEWLIQGVLVGLNLEIYWGVEFRNAVRTDQTIGKLDSCHIAVFLGNRGHLKVIQVLSHQIVKQGWVREHKTAHIVVVLGATSCPPKARQPLHFEHRLELRL